MIELKFNIGPDSFQDGHYVYVWLAGDQLPFYVGETGKSPIDRAGLHIRDRSRSGAIVSNIIQLRENGQQEYTVLVFPIELKILDCVCKENGASSNRASYNCAQKAVERAVYDSLITKFENLHEARGCRWSANSVSELVKKIVERCDVSNA